MQENIAYALVFLAVAGVLLAVWSMADEAGRAEGERRDMDASLDEIRRRTPLERFISPGRLFRLQLAFSLMPAILVPAAFLMAGLAKIWFLAAFSISFAVIGWKGVKLRYMHLVAARQREFESKILDFSAGLANAMKSGMAFPQAVERISGHLDGPMKEELSIVLREYRLGNEMSVALERLAARMPCEDIKLLAASVKLTGKTGGSLADVLQEITAMIRGRREFADKVKTLTAQGRFEGLVLGLMPAIAFLIFHFIHPELMSMLYTTTAGWCAIAVAGILEAFGFAAIAKITKIEV